MFSGVPLFMPFLLTNISNFFQFHKYFPKILKFSKIDKKFQLKNLKLKKKPKTQAKNSGSGRHSPLSSAQVMLKKMHDVKVYVSHFGV